jgi:hypothetical protein
LGSSTWIDWGDCSYFTGDISYEVPEKGGGNEKNGNYYKEVIKLKIWILKKQ